MKKPSHFSYWVYHILDLSNSSVLAAVFHSFIEYISGAEYEPELYKTQWLQ